MQTDLDVDVRAAAELVVVPGAPAVRVASALLEQPLEPAAAFFLKPGQTEVIRAIALGNSPHLMQGLCEGCGAR